MGWVTEWSFDGKLCQKYSYQKLSKSVNWFLSDNQKCRGFSFWDTVCVCVCAVAHSLSGILVESLDGDGLSMDNRLSCLNALKMTVYLLCQMCEQYELSIAKPVTLAVATKVRHKQD